MALQIGICDSCPLRRDPPAFAARPQGELGIPTPESASSPFAPTRRSQVTDPVAAGSSMALLIAGLD